MKPLPLPTLSERQVKLFWSHVDRRGPSECWPWTGLTTGRKYKYGIWRVQGRLVRPHRIAYTLAIGPIPDELTIDHVKARGCTSKLCCNPAHLEPATMTEQVIRRDGEKSFTRVTTCKWGHVRPVGRKAYCLECASRFQAEHRARKLAGPEADAYRAKCNASRQRQRAAVKAREQEQLQPELEFAQ